MSWTVIDSTEALSQVFDAVDGASAIAVDTEFMRRNTYYPQVALLQICADDHAWLIDPLTITDATSLIPMLHEESAGDKAVEAAPRLLHSCSEDLEVFRHWLNAVPAPLIDTQRAAALVGEAFGLGYRALVQQLSGIELEKGETRSDWLKRPLTDSQCHYAAQDVIQLLPVWEILKERADKMGRLEWMVEESGDALLAQEDRERELFRRVKGASRLGRRQLAALRAVVNWREERARRIDKPRGWVLDDKACLEIARSMPSSPAELERIDGIPPAVLRRQGDALLASVERARSEPEAGLPEASPEPLKPAQRDKLKTLRSAAAEIAKDLAVAPEILISNADLDALIRLADGSSIAEPRRWQGWRRDVIIDPLCRQLGVA